MRKGLTELVFILDRSGSMSGLEADTIGGYNALMEKQKKEEGEALVSTVLFDDKAEVIFDRVALDKVPAMTEKEYYVRGCTALLDALGGAIHHIGNVHKYAREEDRPEKTLFIITTDGQENSSHIYTYEKVKKMVERQKEKYGWEFLFLGANIDAIAEAKRFGIAPERAVRYQCDGIGTAVNFSVLSKAVSKVRSCSAERMSEALEAGWKEEIEADYRERDKIRRSTMEKTMKVTGKGKLAVKPDMIRLLLDTGKVCPTYEEALRQSSEQTEELKNCFETLGFARSDLKTLRFSVDTEYENYRDENNVWKNRFLGYRFTHGIKLEFDADNERLGHVLYALGQTESRPEFRINYTVKDTEAAKNKLLAKAVADSKEKAKVLAEAAGVSLGDIVNIDYSWGELEIVSAPVERCMMSAPNAAGSYKMDIEPDDIDVTDTVTVVWEIK